MILDIDINFADLVEHITLAAIARETQQGDEAVKAEARHTQLIGTLTQILNNDQLGQLQAYRHQFYQLSIKYQEAKTALEARDIAVDVNEPDYQAMKSFYDLEKQRSQLKDQLNELFPV